MGETSFNIPDENLEQHIITLFEKLECMRREAKASGNCEDLSGRVPARLELRTLSLWKAVVAECVASFLYVFIVCGAASGAGVGASASAVLLTTALASGCAMATLSMCFAKISGAHVNPAVSTALCVRRLVSPLRTALYIAAQCGGGIAGAAAIYGVSVPGYTGSLAAALPGGGGGGGAPWERLGAELVLTALVAAAHGAARERRWTGSAPALLGAAYTAASFVSMPSLNPARSLGPSFVLSRWEAHWVSWAGGLGGGALAGLAHEWSTRRRGASRASSPRDLDELDKPAFSAPHHYRPTYCAAAPRPDTAEPLYSGTKSLYCRSPPPARHALHRSVFSALHHNRPMYCAAAPRPDTAKPLYSGTKSLYCRSPPPARHALHRSQSVYSKGSSAASAVTAGAGVGAGASALAAAQSLVLRPVPAHAHTHALAHAQNAQNAQRDPPYGTANGVRPGPAGAAVSDRRESVYSAGVAGVAGMPGGARRPLTDDAYGTYSRAPPYRAHPQDHY